MTKRWLRRLLLILLVTLILCALVFPASGSSGIYFMAINENIHEMTAENIPVVSGATLYVPYTMFSPQITGVNMGVRAQYNASRSILTVTDGQKTVTFDTRRNTAYDEVGTDVGARALVRNSMAYLPIHWLCSHFPSINYTLTRTPYGILIRATNADVILTDAQFVDAAIDILQDNLVRYLASITVPEPSPTVTATPEPTPTQPPTPPPTVEPTPAPVVYLALRAGTRTSEAANALEREKLSGLFLFTVDEMFNQDDLIRRLVARGHQIGLALTGSDPNTCAEQLSAGRQLMADIARCPIFIVSADELAPEHHQALRNAGCAIWSATLHQGEGTDSAALLDRLDPNHVNFLEILCDESGATLLSRSLTALTGDNFRLYLTTAAILS